MCANKENWMGGRQIRKNERACKFHREGEA